MRAEDARRLLEEERTRLQRARAALLADHLDDGSQRDALGELSSMDEHVADSATETFDREVEFGLQRTLLAELAEVERALDRLDAGTYGTCRSCGASIPDERLEAVPATSLCLTHQGRAELDDAAVRDYVDHSPAEAEAMSHLDLLPTEDEAGEEEGTAGLLGAEEAAVHVAPERA
jgi:RNA polymerase-binding transcription factor DksA